MLPLLKKGLSSCRVGERTTVVSAVVLLAALLACKGNKDETETESTESEESEEPAKADEAPSAEAKKALPAPSDAEPSQLPEFAGCDLAADAAAFQGAWYTGAGQKIAWEFTGDKVKWYDSAEHSGDFRVATPCSFERGDNERPIQFVRANNQLIVGTSAAGRTCGDRTVGCTSDLYHVISGDTCTGLTMSSDGVKAGSGPNVRHWTRKESQCYLEKGSVEVLVLNDASGTSHRVAKKANTNVYLSGGYEALKLDSFATGKRLVDLGNEEGKVPESGAERVKVTEGYEKLCDETKNALACNQASWFRCVNLKQCNLSVSRARTAVEQGPDKAYILDTLAVVLCMTDKTEESDTYFKKSCDAGYAKNCARKCNADLRAEFAGPTVVKQTPTPVASAAPAASANTAQPTTGGGRRSAASRRRR